MNLRSEFLRSESLMVFPSPPKAYFLPCDIRQFFPSIDHAILQSILARLLPDASLKLSDRRAQRKRRPPGPPAQQALQKTFAQHYG